MNKMAFGELLRTQRVQRKLDPTSFATFLGVTTAELEKLEAGEATVSLDRAEYWAELLSNSRVDMVQRALEARQNGAKALSEGLAGIIHRRQP
jgi:predicted transcriptional regulator